MGLDRKNKAEIISTNLQNDQLFVIDLEKDVNIEKIAANKTQVIDFILFSMQMAILKQCEDFRVKKQNCQETV